MNIGEVSRRSGCHIETIRYYERSGLLPAPKRSAGGYRQYADSDVDRLRFIARGRTLGFSLEEIRSLLQLADDPALSCAEVDQLASQHLADIKARMADLRRMAVALQRTLEVCQGGKRGECAILQVLGDAKSSPRAAESDRPAVKSGPARKRVC